MNLGNNIGAEGGQALAEALNEDATFIELGLQGS